MLLIIDNYDSFTYNLYQALAVFHANVRVIRHDKITLNEIQTLQPMGIVLSPGPGRPENAGICVDLIRALVAGELNAIPLLGVCLGHQAITVALGGEVMQAPEIVHGKQDSIFHQQSGFYQHLPQPFIAGRYHSLIAKRDTLPATLLVEAHNNAQFVMGVRHIELPIHGVQFHPESILSPQGPLLLQAFVALCKKRKGLGVAA